MTEYGVVGSTVDDHHLVGIFCALPPNVGNAVSQTDDKTAIEPVLASSSSSSSVQQQPQAPQSRAHQSQAVHHHQQLDHSVPPFHPSGLTACPEDVQLDIANHFPPWLAAVADAEQQQLQQQQFMHFPPSFPTMMMPFDYGTLVPPPPPPMAYPTPHGQAVYDEQHQQHQQQFFGGLYDSLAAALAAGGGQFGPLMHPASSSASFGEGPSGSNINHNNENNDFYAYQHQLNIALSQYPPPPASSTAAMAPYPVEEYSHRSAEQQPPPPPHHSAYAGAGNSFELYMQHNHPPPMFIYPPPNDGCQQQQEFGGGGGGTTTTSASYAAEHEHQQQEWKHLAAAMTASANAGRRVTANPTGGGGGGGGGRSGQKRGADGRPQKISNTSSFAVGGGHLTVPSTSRRSSSASTKAHLSSATVSPIHSHSNGPPAEYTPSKKKQSMKSSDCKYLCVGNRSKIALFNRLRSQTVSTRYLHVEGSIPATNSTPQRPPVFVASSTKWGAFHINVVEPADYTGQQPQHSVTYGSVIQLVDSQTEMRLPLMRIRKVDKQYVLLDPAGQGEPVSQLHKCAFQMVDGTSNGAELFYLCLSHDKIIQHQAMREDGHRHQISDGAAWTIISTDKAEFRWAEPYAASGSLCRKPITPVPQLFSLNMLDASHKLLQAELCNRTTGSATVELNGLNFSSKLRVWFGATPAETIYCTSERLSCAVPSLFTVCKDLGCTVAEAALAHADTGGKLAVPLLLARNEDGILFPTGHSFPYQLQRPATLSESLSAIHRSAEMTESRQNLPHAKNEGVQQICTDSNPKRFFTNNNGIGEAHLLMNNAN
uniref:BTD domain-containing protein n=1 Tax=Globodera pallida TaxID=36090 RepID=A0A183C023_GLOPA